MNSKITVEQLVLNSCLKSRDAEFLLKKLTKLSSTQIFLKKDVVSPEIAKKFKEAEDKILAGVPIQYAVGKCDFYGREFSVDKNVLIPRVETELLVEQAVEFIKSKIFKVHKVGFINIIDVGTGSGCIAISLSSEIAKFKISNSKFKITATDISSAVLKIARKNAKNHHVKIKFYKSDLFSNSHLPKKFDLILANLPYLPNGYLVENPDLKYEPKLALSGGKKGLKIIEKMISMLPGKLNSAGLAILEIDPRQSQSVKRILEKYPKLKFKLQKDLNGRVRFTLITHL